MKNVKNLMLLLFFPIAVCAQYTIKGTVEDSNNIPISFANIYVQDATEKIVSGGVSDDDGVFEFSLNEGQYRLVVSFLGYKEASQTINVTSDLDLGAITLETDNVELAEVVVTQKKKIFERKIDRFVFNVENSPSLTGGIATDALKVTPGISLDDQGITLIGKSSLRVMVEGKLLNLSGVPLMDFLSSIPAGDIKSIEVITNPPAKYAVEGNSGLINIIYKRNKSDSWYNSTSGSFIRSLESQYSISNNLNYKKGKTSFILSLSAKQGDLLHREFSDSFQPDLETEVFNGFIKSQEGINGSLQYDYKVSNKVQIGVQYLGQFTKPSYFTEGSSSISRSLTTNEETINDIFSTDDRKNDVHSVNIFSEVKLDTIGSKISLNLAYFNYNSESALDVDSRNRADNILNFSNLNNSNQNLENSSVNLDFENPIKSTSLSYGVRFSNSVSKNDTDNFNTITGTPVFSENESDEFEFTEKNYAAYFNLKRNFGKKWSMQFGLRYEKTETEGVSFKLDRTDTNDYDKFFPTFYVSYKGNENNSYNFNYGKRISRPSFWALNPAPVFTSDITLNQGNPSLLPSFYDNLEFSHSYKDFLSTTIGFSRGTDGSAQVPVLNEAGQINYLNRNFYNINSFSISQNYQFNKISWFDTNFGFYLVYNDTEITDNDVSIEARNGWRLYGYNNNTFIFGKKKRFRFRTNFWFNTPFRTLYYDFDGNYKLDLSLNYNAKRWNFSMTFSDVFNSRQNDAFSFVNGITYRSASWYNNQNLRFSATYKIGSNLGLRSRRFGNRTERNRIGN